MTRIPNTDYYTDGCDIYSHTGRRLKPDRHDVMHLTVNRTRLLAPRAKLVWCASRNVDPRKVGKGYSFFFIDGKVEVSSFSDRMSEVRREWAKTTKVKLSDYDFVEKYVKLAKAQLLGDKRAELMLYALLDSRRQELEDYGLHAAGGVGKDKAAAYADTAIWRVYNTIINHTRYVPSPMASMMFYVRQQIKDGRNKPIEL